jgi:bacterioferritin-associated ferredoxin
MDAEELSAYELERLANIKRNEEKLSALGLSTGIVPVAAAPRPKRKKSEVTRPPAAPSRRSGRIEGSKAPELYVEHETGSGTRCVVTVGGDRSLLEAEAKVSTEAELDPLELFSMGAMPEDESDLLEGEKPAWQALYQAKREKARELQIEGYKVAQHRTLCEVVRRVCTSVEALRACWGFGGKGVLVDKYGEMFVAALAPHVAELRAVHAAAKVEAEEEQVREASASAACAAGDKTSAASSAAASGGRASSAMVDPEPADAAPDPAAMPTTQEDLLPDELPAFEALIAATHERAEATGQGKFYWNVAPRRSVCEMVRRVPTTLAELMECHGMGGQGVKAKKHGAFLLNALEPFAASLRALHAEGGLAGAAMAPGSGQPEGSGAGNNKDFDEK